jgi:hypothetical protein
MKTCQRNYVKMKIQIDKVAALEESTAKITFMLPLIFFFWLRKNFIYCLYVYIYKTFLYSLINPLQLRILICVRSKGERPKLT